MVKFRFEGGILYQQLDDKVQPYGCSEEDGSDFVLCEECSYKYNCPAGENLVVEINKRESDGSITIPSQSGTGVERKLNINCYRVADSRLGCMSLAVLDPDGKLLGDVVLDADAIRIILCEISRLI